MPGTRTSKPNTVTDGLRLTLLSPSECDRNGEPANIVDGLFAIARALHAVADAIRQTAPASSSNGVQP
jgi:hypothetical protein